AEVSGGSLALPAGAPATLGEALVQPVEHVPDQLIVTVRADLSESTLTYRDLFECARRLLTGLRRAGLRAGDAAILQISDLDQYFGALWACVLGGIRPVTVAVPPTYDAQNSVVQKLQQAWQLI